MVTTDWQRVPGDLAPQGWADHVLGDIAEGQGALFEKRLLDLFIAGLGLIVFAPVMLLAAMAIKVSSRGPVLHHSRRLGRNGRIFHCLKFRTMTADEAVTSIGAWLRRYGLDELPQLVNVLRGDMSVVGPRPVMASAHVGPQIYRMRRFEMTPGMTGLWAAAQHDFAAAGAFVSPDETYRNHWSLWLDLRIIVRSLGTALAGRG